MSTIRKALRVLREELPEFADEAAAAEAQLSELEQTVRIARTQREGMEAALALLAERKKADAQLRPALEEYKRHELSQDRLVRALFDWAAKGGGQ